MKKGFGVIILLLSMHFGIAQKKISGVIPEKTITIEGQTLTYNGAGLREKFFLDIYVGTLYTTSKTSDGKKVINADEPMAITLDIVSGLITSEKMIDAVDEGFEKSTGGNQDKYAAKIKEFKGGFSEEIKNGNDFTIAYIPNKGTIIHKNGKLIKTIEGLEFKKAVFGIWFCDEPADKDLMEGMLELD